MQPKRYRVGRVCEDSTCPMLLHRTYIRYIRRGAPCIHMRYVLKRVYYSSIDADIPYISLITHLG